MQSFPYLVPSQLHYIDSLETICLNFASEGDPRRESLANELQVEEATLNECVEKLKLIEANRAALVTHLKEALSEQVCEYSNRNFVNYACLLRKGPAFEFCLLVCEFRSGI